MRDQLARSESDAGEDDPDVVVVYDAKFDEYGLPVRDGGASMVVIGYCPWCGGRLPASRRDAWFDAVEGLGLDAWEDEVPGEFRGDGWWARDLVEETTSRDYVEPEKVISPA
ncbi:hypothetical protein [Dactylosporangium sp. NPDC005555]|uniref:DUF6980 family protein n=1 Tax=Dactylosporangium sp. NPDC005555 TaxID=3154889 RepID=UPI0033A7C98B